MPHSTIGMSRVLWAPTKKPGSILLPWPSISMNSVTKQKHVKWNSGTGWVTQYKCLKWSRRVANCQQEMANEFDRFTQRLSDFINSCKGSHCLRVPHRQAKILVPKYVKSRRPWRNGLIKWKDKS